LSSLSLSEAAVTLKDVSNVPLVTGCFHSAYDCMGLLWTHV
jgi:hypothetical protein